MDGNNSEIVTIAETQKNIEGNPGVDMTTVPGATSKLKNRLIDTQRYNAMDVSV